MSLKQGFWMLNKCPIQCMILLHRAWKTIHLFLVQQYCLTSESLFQDSRVSERERNSKGFKVVKKQIYGSKGQTNGRRFNTENKQHRNDSIQYVGAVAGSSMKYFCRKYCPLMQWVCSSIVTRTVHQWSEPAWINRPEQIK